jgi:hypothetical protein
MAVERGRLEEPSRGAGVYRSRDGFGPVRTEPEADPNFFVHRPGKPATRGSGRDLSPNPTREDGFGRLTNPRPEGSAQIENPI